MRVVDRAVVHVQQVGTSQLDEQGLVQPEPYPGLGPVPEPPPAGDPGAADLFGRDVRPGHALAQDIDDPGECCTVVHRLPSGKAVPPRWPARDQRGYPLPQVVGHKIIVHAGRVPEQSS